MAAPAHLSVETIINLAENGVDASVLEDMLTTAFQDKVDKLTLWDGPDGHYKLWRNILKEGHVIPARLARQETGSARAKGYIYEDATDDWEEDDLEAVDQDSQQTGLTITREKSIAWWGDPISGQPSSLEETCLVLLDSGFCPGSSPLLRSKLLHVAEKSIKSLSTRYRLSVPMSCSAFVIPGIWPVFLYFLTNVGFSDPCDVLEPGEVHIKSSHRNLLDVNGSKTDTIIGNVLVSCISFLT